MITRRSGSDYAEALSALFPSGSAWPRDPASALMQLVRGLGDVWGRVDARAADLAEIETDPRFTSELLSDWERAFGLPERIDAVLAAPSRVRVGTSRVGQDGLMLIDRAIRSRSGALVPPASNTERRNALLAKMTAIGGQSRAYFVGIAAALGYSVSITEFSPFMCGVSRLGDTRQATGSAVWFRCGQSHCGLDHHLRLPSDRKVVGEYRWRLGPPSSRFGWRVNVSGFRAERFQVGRSRLGQDRLTTIRPRPERFMVGLNHVGTDPLLKVGRAYDLEAIFRKWKPAQTQVVFNYAQVQP